MPASCSTTNQISVNSRPSSMIHPNAISSYPDGALVASKRVDGAQSCICSSEGSRLWRKYKDRISLSNDEQTGTKYRCQRVDPFSDDQLHRDCSPFKISFHTKRRNVALRGLRTVVSASEILPPENVVENSDGVSIANKECRNDVGVNYFQSGNEIIKYSDLERNRNLKLRCQSREARSRHYFASRSKGAPVLELADINVDQYLHKRLSPQ